MRRVLKLLGGLFGLVSIVLAVEVYLALSRTHLDDEVGSRPSGLLVGDRDGPPVVTVWFGDSTSTGVGASTFEESVAFGVAAADAARFDRPVALTVFGVSGHQVHEVLDEQIPEFLASGIEPDRIYISVGGNDVTALTRRPTFRSRYRRMLDEIRSAAPDAHITVLGVPDMGSVTRLDWPLRAISGWRGDALDDDVHDAATKRGIRHVDIATETGPAFRKDPDFYLAADLFHPSDEGYQLWIDAVTDR